MKIHKRLIDLNSSSEIVKQIVSTPLYLCHICCISLTPYYPPLLVLSARRPPSLSSPESRSR